MTRRAVLPSVVASMLASLVASLGLAVTALSAAAPSATAAPASASASTAPSAAPSTAPSAAPPAAVRVADMVVGRLPAGLGTPSQFRYHFAGVHLTTRVWESADGYGGSRVDLDVTVMRGARLTDGATLRDWYVHYSQRHPRPRYLPVRLHGAPGWLCADQLFWLVRPGVAVSVQLDVDRFAAWDVVRTARSVHAAPGTD